jgi:hypothetical protein
MALSVSSRYTVAVSLFPLFFLPDIHVSRSIALSLSPSISLSRIQYFWCFILYVSLSGYLLMGFLIICVYSSLCLVPILAVFPLSPVLAFSFSSVYLGFFLLSVFILFLPFRGYIFRLS